MIFLLWKYTYYRIPTHTNCLKPTVCSTCNGESDCNTFIKPHGNMKPSCWSSYIFVGYGYCLAALAECPLPYVKFVEIRSWMNLFWMKIWPVREFKTKSCQSYWWNLEEWPSWCLYCLDRQWMANDPLGRYTDTSHVHLTWHDLYHILNIRLTEWRW